MISRASASDLNQLVQALVAELAVESLHLRVLRRLTGPYQTQRHAVSVGPGTKRVTV
jgi:hypothetical protein